MKYEKDNLEKIVKESFSIADVCRKLDIRPVGGNYKTIKKYVKLYNIDKSHFTGQGWNTGENFKNFSKTYSLDEILVENSTYTNNGSLKKRLIEEDILEYKCDECGINEWKRKSISLHLDHINGDNLDNRLENLRLLCPNCHSQTSTYCGKSKTKSNKSDLKKEKYQKYQKKEKKKYYCECGNEMKTIKTMCRMLS